MGPLFFLCVCVSVHSHALLLIMCVCAWFTLNCSLLLSPPFSKLTALLLRDCSILAAVWHHLLLSLQQLDHVVPVRRRAWSTRQMRWGPARGSEMIWRSRSLCVPGLLRWWTTLWMAVTAEPGGLTQGWLCQPARSTPSSRSDECKIDKGSLICADKGKTHWLPQQLLPVVLGKLN